MSGKTRRVAVLAALLMFLVMVYYGSVMLIAQTPEVVIVGLLIAFVFFVCLWTAFGE